jgi:2,4-dienoyl-CoA reductase-like NADH-dependent reductase (Old Yellow Enzyme family)/thioredoxin reductase
MNSEFRYLFQPYKFRTFEIENRIVMPPMAIYIPGSKGFVTQKLIDYYEERAKGGPGLIIFSATPVSLPSGNSHPNMTVFTDDKFIPGFKSLVDTIHNYGVKTSIQLYHAGRQRYGMIAGGETLSPSGIPDPVRKDPTRAITIEEIKSLVKEYGLAAGRAKAAGFDGIELHCAHGYLLSGFLSPFQNKRTDQYGGDICGRTRIVREILASCREFAGDDMLLGVRINGHDYVNGGNTLEDARRIAKVLVEAGAELIHVSAGMAPSGHFTFLPASVPQGYNVPLAEGIKEAVGPKVPVIACGAIEDPLYAEEVLSRGKVDLVAIGRPLFADPELPRKAKEGRLNEIRPCLRCSKSAGVWPDDMRCTVNPAVSKEREYADSVCPSGKRKKVLVIGAGPGGLEAARTAAMKGHEVTLVDREEQVGGKIWLAMKPSGKDTLLKKWLAYYENEMHRLKVKVILNQEILDQDILKYEPDTIIVATGGTPLIPTWLEGAGLPGVVTSDDVLLGKVEVGKNIAVIGGSSAGVETAEYILQDESRRVVVLELLHDILLDISHDAEIALLDKLEDKNFHTLTMTQVTAVEEDQGKLNLRIRKYGHDELLKGFDTVVLACGVVPNNSLALALKGMHKKVLLVGDCSSPGDFRKAVHDGAAAGVAI